MADNPNPQIRDITIRTMESDQKSITQEGGGEPKPYTPPMGMDQFPKVPSMDPSTVPPIPKPEPSRDSWQTTPQTPSAPLPVTPPRDMMAGMGREKPPKKSMFPIVLAALAVIGVGVALYLLAPSLFTKKQAEPALEEPEIGEELPLVEPEEEIIPPIEEEEVTPSGVPASSHLSLFATPPDSTEEAVFSGMTLGDFRAALALSPTEVPLFREVVFTDQNQNLVSFDEVISVLAPDTFAATDIREAFQPDATYYTYTNAQGTWFGFAAKLKTGANREAVQTAVKGFETTGDVPNFFLSGVTGSPAWKGGVAGDVTSRYATFAETGAAFNYGWSGDVLLVGTSYQGFSSAETRL